MADKQLDIAILREVAAIVDAGGLKPVLDETEFSIDGVGDAHARLESGRAMGKVVVQN